MCGRWVVIHATIPSASSQVANAPRVLLADEPTGNLDPRTSEHVFVALTELVEASGLAVVVATHNLDIAARMHRRVTLRDGLVVELR